MFPQYNLQEPSTAIPVECGGVVALVGFGDFWADVVVGVRHRAVRQARFGHAPAGIVAKEHAIASMVDSPGLAALLISPA